MNIHQCSKHLALLFILLVVAMSSQAFDNSKYFTFADGVRRGIWAQDIPEFKNYTCPDKYRNESAVVLASRIDITVTHQTQIGLSAMLFLNAQNEMTSKTVSHYLVHIGDENALKSFSEFDYSTVIKDKGWQTSQEKITVVGVRLIKPDGTIKEISTSDYVTTTEGKKDDNQRQKIEVPGMEVGDNLEYFVFELTKLVGYTIPPFYFLMQNDYPKVSQKIHMTIDEDIPTEYWQLNGAPDFVQGKDENGNITLNFSVNDTPKEESGRWYNALRQTPLLVVKVYGKRDETNKMIMEKRPKGVVANPDAAAVQREAWRAWDFCDKYSQWGSFSSKDKTRIMKRVEESKQLFTDEDSRADYLYNYLYYSYLVYGFQFYSPKEFIHLLSKLYDDAGVEYQRGITTFYYSEPIDKLIDASDAVWFLRLKSGRFIFPIAQCNYPSEILSSVSGQKAQINTNNSKKVSDATYEAITIPELSLDGNSWSNTINATIDGSRLNMERTSKYTGIMKEAAQKMLVGMPERAENYQHKFAGEKSFADIFGPKYAETRAANLKEAAEESKEIFKKETKLYHKGMDIDWHGYKLVSIGNTADSSAFVYTTNYTLDNILKKAGPDIIVSVGELMSDDIDLNGSRRVRTGDIQMDTHLKFVWSISIALPDGYMVTPESIAKLNKNMDNDVASLTIKGAVKDNKLIVDFTRIFKNRYIDKAKWQQILDIADASKEFTATKVVLKKM
jgi:hypothetical protein